MPLQLSQELATEVTKPRLAKPNLNPRNSPCDQTFRRWLSQQPLLLVSNRLKRIDRKDIQLSSINDNLLSTTSAPTPPRISRPFFLRDPIAAEPRSSGLNLPAEPKRELLKLEP